jgi:predicted membrane chloride channel (bestrophin family)
VARNFSRMARLYKREIGDSKLQSMMNLLAAFPYLLRHHIRPGCLCESNKAAEIPSNWRLRLDERPVDLETRHEGDNLLKYNAGSGVSQRNQRPHCWVDRRNLPWRLFESEKTLGQVSQSHNRPLWVCDRLAREISKIPYGPNFSSRERLTLLQHVEKLTNAVGQCERIHQTAVPLNYARHSLRSLTIWLFTLPFCLVKEMGMLTPIVTAVSAWTLFGIYQIGYSIEDPFQGSLRLSILCDSIRRDVLMDYGSGPDEQHFGEPISHLEEARSGSTAPKHVHSVFSNGTVVDSTMQQDLGRLMNPPNLLVEVNDASLLTPRPIDVHSLP